MIRLTVLISIFALKSSSAQFENLETGARAIGLNGAFTSLANNSLAVFYNPSGLGQLKYREVSAFFSPSAFGLNEISTAALSYTEPFNIGTFGIGLRTFGFDLYRESNVILSFGAGLKERIFYGFNVNYYNLSIKNYGTASSIGIDAGTLAYITSYLRWGFCAKNVSGAKIGISDQRIAQVYKTGFSLQPQNDYNLILEIEKDVKYPLSVRSALEYSVTENIDLRAGIGTEPASFSAGFSIAYDVFQIDYAFCRLNELGYTNQGSVTINFGGKKARNHAREQLKKAFK